LLRKQRKTLGVNFFAAPCWHITANVNQSVMSTQSNFYAQKQPLLSARLSHRNSVRPFVCHTGGSVKSGAS